jgi:hypothetical protein
MMLAAHRIPLLMAGRLAKYPPSCAAAAFVRLPGNPDRRPGRMAGGLLTAIHSNILSFAKPLRGVGETDPPSA